MLGSRLTAENEAEVEDELEALEKEMGGVADKNEELPNVPTTNLTESQKFPEVVKAQKEADEAEERVPVAA